jgi:hypothetical protein
MEASSRVEGHFATHVILLIEFVEQNFVEQNFVEQTTATRFHLRSTNRTCSHGRFDMDTPFDSCDRLSGIGIL